MTVEYRLATPNDAKALKAICDQHKMHFPETANVIILALEYEEIVGVIAVTNYAHIDPIIATKPMVAHNLGQMLEGILIATGVPIVRAEVKGEMEKWIATLEKFGYKVIDKNMVLLEKVPGKPAMSSDKH